MTVHVTITDGTTTFAGAMEVVRNTVPALAAPTTLAQASSRAPMAGAPAAAASHPELLTLRYFGAKGDGRTDDSKAIETAKAALADTGQFPTGARLHVAAGIYPIGLPLDMSGLAGRGIAITGDGLASKLMQTTDNTPIIRLPGMHSQRVCDLWLGYARPQRSSALEAMAIQGVTVASDVSGFYNSRCERLFIENAAVAIGARQGAVIAPIWGNRFADIMCSNLSVSVFKLNAGSGQPNNRFESIYVNCPSMTGTMFDLGPADSVQMDNIEINNWSGCRLLDLSSGGSLRVGEWRIEVGTCAPTGKTSLINLQNLTSCDWGRLAVYNTRFTAKGGDIHLFNLDTVGRFVLGTLEGRGNTVGPMVYGFNAPNPVMARVEWLDAQGFPPLSPGNAGRLTVVTSR